MAPFDKAFASSGSSSDILYAGNPRRAPELAILFPANNAGNPNTPAGFTLQNPLWWKIVTDSSPLNIDQSMVGGPALWAAILAFVGSNGNVPVFTTIQTGSQNPGTISLAAFTPAAGESLIFFAACVTTTGGGFTQPKVFTLTDDQGNVYTLVASPVIINGDAGAEAIMFICEAPKLASTHATLTLISGGISTQMSYTFFRVTNLNLGAGPFGNFLAVGMG